jgi:hypothetical protein
MKALTKYFILLQFALLISPGAAAQDIEGLLGLPQWNSDVRLFFNNSMENLMSLYHRFEDYRSHLFFDVIYAHGSMIAAFPEDRLASNLSIQMSTTFRVFGDFSIPLYFASSGSEAAVFSDWGYYAGLEKSNRGESGVILGSGLIYSGSAGTIGAFIGQYIRTLGERDATGEIHDWDRVIEKSERLYFSLIPIINIAKFPVLGLFFSAYEGLWDFFQEDLENSWQHKLVSKSINFDTFLIQSIGIYYKQARHDAAASAKTYGVTVNILNPGVKHSYLIDFGYSDFYDVWDDLVYPDSYQDSFFLGFKLDYQGVVEIPFGFSFFFDHTFFPIPRIGLYLQMYFISSTIELSYKENHFYLFLGLRLNIDSVLYRGY